MKNRVRIITVLALIFVASYSLRAQRYGSYSIDRLESEVYYEGMYVRGADASTFEDEPMPPLSRTSATVTARTAVMCTDMGKCWNM